MTQSLQYLRSVVDGEQLAPEVDAKAWLLARELVALERQERQVSDLRRSLHDRLASFPNPSSEERERQLSAHRKELHEQIDALRVELAMLGWRD